MKNIVQVFERLLAALERHDITDVGNVIPCLRRAPAGAHPDVVNACERLFGLKVILARSLSPAAPPEVR